MTRKYREVFKLSWEEGLAYRLNFVLWRVRTVLQLVLIYFIWWTVFQNNDTVFGYSQAQILTYILVSAFIRAIILSSRANSISDHINQGDIGNFLVKPLGLIKYYFIRDFADKLLNISFVIVEISLIYFLLKPEIILPINVVVILLFILAVILGALLFFIITYMIGLLAFWVENSWGPMFLGMIILEGFGGSLFPIDILPAEAFNFLMLTPFPYLIYFPSKIFVGGLTQGQIYTGFLVLIFWLILLWFSMNKILQKGLKKYTAVGH